MSSQWNYLNQAETIRYTTFTDQEIDVLNGLRDTLIAYSPTAQKLKDSGNQFIQALAAPNQGYLPNYYGSQNIQSTVDMMAQYLTYAVMGQRAPPLTGPNAPGPGYTRD